ncbi:enolase C-terminal domain-like protein [Desulfoluna spongiiphila]|uniref:enolase C-terminal domain-like protein n=1 Tax=Desulfoluna spongiiphila TaxID=419481 RepID=UPI001258D9E5|nr:enolase C-terminal domain-like protein [Desulfoluna spongiiphila]VVS91093.1 enolase-like n-terminal [Desulfoluna spongiiphila]
MNKPNNLKPIVIHTTPLRLPLKTTISHASASRKKSESILVQVIRGDLTGYGEGCPRSYVAGDDLLSSLAWVNDVFGNGPFPISTLDELARWVNQNKRLIDTYPSAWCAVEMALIDLFARENSLSVEALLGMPTTKRHSNYSAVLGDQKLYMFNKQSNLYLSNGMTDFKVKLSGKMARDQKKLSSLEKIVKEHQVEGIRIRLDANNLWQEDFAGAIAFIKNLKGDFFAVEEPLKARNAEQLSNFSIETGLPVILDESLCTAEDLEQYRHLRGRFIANIKISRVGGLLRAQSLISTLKSMDWDIIIGCHVGETSLLTRCGLVAAAMAGESLIAHEGAFGEYLLFHDPAFPVLTFSRGGNLNLHKPYYFESSQGSGQINPDRWSEGLGMTCMMPITLNDDHQQTSNHTI